MSKEVYRPRIKICCIMSKEEAELAIRYGASALGLVSSMPSGPGVISEELIRDIASDIPAGVSTFLLTSAQDTETIIRQQRYCRTNTIQIVDTLKKGTYADLKEALPGIKIVQVIHVLGDNSVEEAVNAGENGADAILLDSGNPLLCVKELGGTGRTHNWEISRKIVESCRKPVFLAGGLNSDNILQAMDEVRPWGFDICSGVRTGGKLDEWKLKHFMETIFSHY